jgi:hypothetical protein
MSQAAQWCLGELVLSVKQLCLRAGFFQNLVCGQGYYATVLPWFSVSLPTFSGTTYIPSTNTYSSYFTMAYAYARGGTSVSVRMFRPDYWTDLVFTPGTTGATGDFIQELGSFSYRAPYYWVSSRFRIGTPPPNTCTTQLACHAPRDLFSENFVVGRAFTSMTDEGQLGFFLACPPLMRVLPPSVGPLSDPAYPQPNVSVSVAEPVPIVSYAGYPLEVGLDPSTLPVPVNIVAASAEVPVYSPVGSTTYATILGTPNVVVTNTVDVDVLSTVVSDVHVTYSVPLDVNVINSSVDVNLASVAPGFVLPVSTPIGTHLSCYIASDPISTGFPFPVQLYASDRITREIVPVATTDEDLAPPVMLAWSSA